MSPNARCTRAPASSNTINTQQHDLDVRRKLALRRGVEGTDAGFRAFAAFLIEEKDFSFLEETLRLLSPVPNLESPLDPSDVRATEKRIENALEAFRIIMIMFRSLSEASTGAPEIRALYDEYLRILIDNWADVMVWMRHLLFYGPRFTRSVHRSLWACNETLLAILRDPENNIFKMELLSMTCTIDTVFLVLCQINPETGQYHVIQPVPTMDCSIIQLVRTYFTCEEGGWEAMQMRLLTVHPATRQQVISFFIVRMQEVAENAQGEYLLGAANSFTCLMDAVFGLIRDSKVLRNAFHKEGFIFKYTSALSAIIRKAEAAGIDDDNFWVDVSTGANVLVRLFTMQSGNPCAYVPKLIEGGILTCASMSLQHYDRRGVADFLSLLDSPFQTLLYLHPFMYLSKCYAAAERQGDMFTMLPRRSNNPNAQLIQREIRSIFEHNRYTYGQRASKKINMCANLKHPGFDEGHDLNGYFSALRTCGGCHAVNYCSEACQKQDWAGFHSQECPTLALDYRAAQSEMSWTSLRTRRDQLRWLEAHINTTLPGLDELTRTVPNEYRLKKTSVPWPQSFKANSFITVIDLVSTLTPLIKGTHSLNAYYHSTWRHVKEEGPWTPRIEQCIRDMEERPNDILLMEGIFRFNSRKTMYTFMKLRYHALRPKGERYTVMNSFYRLSARKPTHEPVNPLNHLGT
ncbi:hypothetical protein DFP72DRAFT_867977 [Ephemerocybe angulata]|uniref:phytol kinase n=1 Tax=Ephemerocybe angulata TaxID=980116 RepID=A0A8H6MEE1_9AGAR|nr:hypothetical protein DFP72DRAFT_867977 [Tulosesus angulatus]